MRRCLKIEERGDSYRRETLPMIRLKGKWLMRAGFQAGGNVIVELIGSGYMVVRCQSVAGGAV